MSSRHDYWIFARHDRAVLVSLTLILAAMTSFSVGCGGDDPVEPEVSGPAYAPTPSAVSDLPPGVDPTDHLWAYYYSSAAEPDYGWNVGRWFNEDFDTLLDNAYALNEEWRQEVFCQIAEVLEAELPQIILWTEFDADAYSSRLQGVQATVNDLVTWNVADWEIVE